MRVNCVNILFGYVCAIMSCCVTVSAQTVTNGLVGYWPMDNTQLTEVTDHTSTTNHGSFLQGSPSWVAGKFGNALDVYLTTDDYVAIPHHASYNANEAYSLALWLYPISCYRKDIFEKGNVQLNHSASDLYVILSKFGEPGPPAQTFTSVNRTISEWHHLVFVYDPTAGAAAKKLYVDGVVEFSTNTVGAATDTALNSEPIKFSVDTTRRCSARFDDVAMWDRALTSNEVAYLYNGGVGNTVSDLNPAPASAPTNISAFASDSLITLSWATNTIDPDVSTYSVYRGTSSGGPYSQVASNLTDTTCVDTGLVNGTTYYYVLRSADLLGAESGDSSEVSDTPVADATPPAVPSDLAAVAGYKRVYLSWSANNEGDLAGYNVYSSASSGGPFALSQALVSSVTWEESGLANDTTCYYRVSAEDLTGNESAQTATVSATPLAFHDTNPGLVGYWPLDEASGTNLIDLTSTGNDGAFAAGSPSWVAGKFGNALDCDLATDDYAAIPHHASYNMNEAYSLAVWLYPISCYRKDIFEKGNVQLNHVNSGLYVILSKFGDPGPPALYETSVNRTISEWHHFVFVYDPTAGAAAKKLYVDGVVEFSTNTVGAATDTALNSEPIEFSANPSRRCSARFDDVAIWNEALTVDQIESLWSEGVGRTAYTPPPSPTLFRFR